MSRSFLVILVVLAVAEHLHSANGKGGGKYSKEKNRIKEDTRIRQPEENEGASTRKSSGHFRLARSEEVWERARKHLNVDDQRDIFEELKDLDDDEITLKRLRHEGGDKNGDLAAKLQERLHDLLEKYDLLTPAHAKSGTLGAKSRTTERPKKEAKLKSSADQKSIELVFADKKLNKLWAKAKKAGFSAQELADLKTEFDHHQQKLDQYSSEDKLTEVTEFNRFHGLADELSHEERQDPLVGTMEKRPVDVVKVDTEIKDIIKNYGLLKAKITKYAFEPETGDFKEARVEKLWKQALAAGFDRDELLSLRGELAHFERKLDKLQNFHEGGLTEKSQADSRLKAGERSDEHVELEQKVKQYEGRIDSIHADLEQRINSRHNEL